MGKRKVTKIRKITCYGKMHEGQSTHVVCQGPYDDYPHEFILPMGFKSWKKAVAYLVEVKGYDFEEIQEMTAC